ncbi:MAG: AmmeMemoRadiSam system radical SAM enzyme [Desulfuromonadaceae bacterium]|nr:AmmeMemoRadiSam system radical SAM enzyme [Desulfuromonas sp.]MDY0185645.1 AmmeMemoRadiSam system radical SAM enzyme [Desulfuromonadaceae bacterium]
MHEAMYWIRQEDGSVRCALCPHRCKIAEGKRGICNVRENRGGTLYSLNYHCIVASNIDPIEKKPLFHYRPGSSSFSVAAAGCNMRCGHCQNSSISQVDGSVPGENITPAQIVVAAQQSRCRTIAYTYTEPTIYYETMLETAHLAREVGLENIVISNGYIEEAPLNELVPLVQGANIDLKTFDDSIYRQLCGARLAPVLKSLERLKQAGVWLEVTTLIIPGYNDDDAQLEKIAGFIATELGPDVPWHVSAFYPTYLLTSVPPTPVETIKRACQIGTQAGLHYVYSGNVSNEDENTRCPQCEAVVVRRHAYRVVESLMDAGKCQACGALIAGVWNENRD